MRSAWLLVLFIVVAVSGQEGDIALAIAIDKFYIFLIRDQIAYTKFEVGASSLTLDTLTHDCGPLCRQWEQTTLNITRLNEHCNIVEIIDNAEVPDQSISVCLPYKADQWFGGAERWLQDWPVQTLNISEEPFVTTFQNNQGIAEPYWVTSSGESIYVSRDVPLFIDSNTLEPGSLCLISKDSSPYNPRQGSKLSFEWCELGDPVTAHRYNLAKNLGKPSGTPDELMIRKPIWSTWARYKRDINEEIVLQYLAEIQGHGFSISQLEIDDKWEPCYGAWTFDQNKFPDIRRVTEAIHANGTRATLWVYPFVNEDCEPYFTQFKEEGRFVKDVEGNVVGNWWNGKGASVDFTNQTTAQWWIDRTEALRKNSGLDSFKFDAGESGYLPQLPDLNIPPELYPDLYTTRYVEAVSGFGGVLEARVGKGTQTLPVFIRMIDKDSRWGLDNGLKSLVTTLLQMNLAGYPFVLPDMIGGNVYGSDNVSKELFIRWLQANTFMPALQFSVVPWGFDQETIDISLKYVALHESYSDVIIAAAQRAVLDGSPINPPVWWIAPTDPETYKINDQFLLGEKLLVAPVLEQGAVSRDIYLPAGQWLDLSRGDNTSITGPTWLRQYEAPLDILPYFLKVN